MADSPEKTLAEIRDSLARLEQQAEQQTRIARLTMQSVFVIWILLGILVASHWIG